MEKFPNEEDLIPKNILCKFDNYVFFFFFFLINNLTIMSFKENDYKKRKT